MWRLNGEGTGPLGRRSGDLSERPRDLSPEDVLLSVGECGDLADGLPEVGGQDFLRSVGEPVRDEERVVLREVRLTEDEEELAPLVEGLDGVGQSFLEVPQVTGDDVVDEVAAVLVDGRDAGVADEHEAPLGLLVPVELPVGPGFERHVHPGHRVRARQLPVRHLARPSAGLQTLVSVREAEAHIHKRSSIGGRWDEKVRVLAITHDVTRTEIQPSLCIRLPDRLRNGLRTHGAPPFNGGETVCGERIARSPAG